MKPKMDNYIYIYVVAPATTSITTDTTTIANQKTVVEEEKVNCEHNELFVSRPCVYFIFVL